MAKRKSADADFELEAAENSQFTEEFLTKPTWDDDGVQATAGIGLDGKEYGDPVPMAPPVGFDAPPDLMELMRTMLRQEQYQARLAQEGFDTEEEAADFDVDDDPLPPLTFHELIVDPRTSLALPADASPPPPPSAPQTSTEGKVGGGGAGSQTPPAPDAPSEPPKAEPPVRAT